jgi:hypothetical protein
VRWSYRLEPDGEGTLVTEQWNVSGQSAGQRQRTASFANMMLGGYESHTEELREGMRKTLERIKAAAERGQAALAETGDMVR